MAEKERPNKLVCPVCNAKIDKRAPNAVAKFGKHVAEHQRDPPGQAKQ